MRSGYLPVSGGHEIYYETHGKGRPAVFLHGGPGGGMDKLVLKTYDLTKWSVTLFDQRGCGKSNPFGSLDHNTTWDLVEDIEALRTHLHIDAWFVCGGSWGTTLALAYAEAHPSRVTGLLLRGVCFCDDASFRWLYQAGGASEIYPDSWKGFLSVLPKRLHTADWKTIMKYYQKKLQGSDAQRYAAAWWGWEQSVSYFRPRKDDTPPKDALALALLENHYFVNGCWLTKDQLVKGLSKLSHIPITIVHGRYDLVCPISASFAIRDVLPHTKILVTPDGGHGLREPGTFRRSKQMTRAMRRVWPKHTRKHDAKR
jgi:proline iminopeptidase